MSILKTVVQKFVIVGIAFIMLAGGIQNDIGTAEVFAATANAPTIRMDTNNPMTRDEFLKWASQKGIRYINIDGGIYPIGIFFEWENGKAYNCGDLNNGILNVSLRPGIVSESSVVHVSGAPSTNECVTQESGYSSPGVFTDLTPILFSDDELKVMIENVPHQNPLDARSAITLPNRKLTESELAEWITEYNEMGGATAFELAVVREINRVREQHELHPLALNPTLMISARFKTQEFSNLQYYAHRSPINGSITESARMFGFDGLSVSETITRTGRSSEPAFITTPEGIVMGMMSSTKGHKDILLNPNAKSVGFGSFFCPNSTEPNGKMSHMFYYATKFGF